MLAGFAYTVVGLLLIIATEGSREDRPPFFVASGFWIAGAWLLFSLWRLLPHRRTDVLYLRSFRHDQNTARVRADLIRAFGRGVRVSGIRDPRRRSMKWLRQLNVLVFALHYATPKYLNLEAGDDWKARLWRSLTLCRGAILDVTDLTPYVKDEVRLCFRTLGLDRVLFVCDRRETADQWRTLIASELELPAHSQIQIQIAVWSGVRDGRVKFREAVSAYARQLPKLHPELSPAGSELAYRGSVLEGAPEEKPAQPWIEVVVGGILAGLVTGAVVYLLRLRGIPALSGSLALLMYLWIFFALVRAFFRYLLECGTVREGVLASLTMGLALLALPVVGVAPAVWKVKLSAAKISSASNLHQIGLAMLNYDGENRRLPPAAAYDKSGKPLLSWRVLILPYLEQDALYHQFKLEEPWDSPHNQQLIERMPRIFRHPWADQRTPPGYTHYRVFVSPFDTRGPSAVFRSGTRGRKLIGKEGGTIDAILLVEAKEAVPWTKPDELEYSADKPIPKLGGVFPGIFQAVMADGTVHPLPTDLAETTLRAFITTAKLADPADDVDHVKVVKVDHVKVVKYPAMVETIEQLKGRVLVVHFWANTYPLSKRDFPYLVQMQRKYGPAGMAAISVSLDDPDKPQAWDQVMRFLESQHAAFINNLILNEKPEFWQGKFTFDRPPSVLVFDRKGQVKKQFKDTFTYDGVEKLVKELLAEK